jgi:polysaccharide export outer membrane protein
MRIMPTRPLLALLTSGDLSGLRMVAIASALALSGCNLPSAGPTVSQVERSADPNLDLYLVKVTPGVVQALSRYTSEGFPESFQLQSHRPNAALRPGDIVTVSIYEAGGSPLFGATAPPSQPGQTVATGAQGVALPGQLIEPDGRIMIPFVGRILVAGRSPTQAADEIARGLSTQTVRPQVIVSLVSNHINAVSVGGEVNKAGLVPLTLRGEKLLDVIAQAGGPRFPATEVDVRVMRGREVAAIPLQRVLTNPEDNIVVRPNDTIVLARNPKTFVVLGAVSKVAQYNMESERVTLAEGIARAGGTVDAYGDLAGIFLLRYEPSAFARSVFDTDRAAVNAALVQTPEARNFMGPQTRVIYRVDLTQTNGYFFAQNIALRDKDIIVVANAETAQLQKALTILRGFTGLYFDIGRAGQYVPY